MAQSLGTSLSISQTVYEPSWDETQVKQGMQKHAMGMRRGGRGRGNQERLLLGSYSTSNEAALMSLKSVYHYISRMQRMCVPILTQRTASAATVELQVHVTGLLLRRISLQYLQHGVRSRFCLSHPSPAAGKVNVGGLRTQFLDLPGT
jgi:hypothetical protein